ncbi:MAG: InlB B-repeat-containing protein [Kiritimatiellaeota bacterium]|nr:InlB B-repeat-containing protein [Kiritimatiellota bacterium]
MRKQKFMSLSLRKTVLTGYLALGSAIGAKAQLYVDKGYDGAAGPSDGSEEAPFTEIQDAIRALTGEDDSIVVLPGKYAPFAVANRELTIESTGGAAVTFIDGAGGARCADMGTSTSRDVQLVGFTLMNGVVAGGATAKAGQGGGSYGGTLTDCVIAGNRATAGGGAAYGELINCVVSDNRATGAVNAGHGGGAFYCDLSGCTVSGNVSPAFGGGAYGSGNVVEGCVISQNVALDGGGVSGLNNATGRLAVRGCTISENRATAQGGGAKWGNLERCDVVGNRAGTNGGGVWTGTAVLCRLIRNTAGTAGGGSHTAQLEQCLVQGNVVEVNGAAGGSGTFGGVSYNCTIVGNRCTGTGTAGVGVSGGTHNNSLIWGNTRAGGGTGNVNHNGTAMNFCYTTAPQGSTSVNALLPGNEDPRFVNEAGGNFQLQGASPCIDKGFNVLITPLLAGWDGVDLAGNFRIINGGGGEVVDIGAFEYGVPKRAVYVAQGFGNDAWDGASWETAKKTIQGGVDAVSSYGTVIVSNGVYAAFKTSNRDITIRSLNGPEDTIVAGTSTNRCATLAMAPRQNQTKLVGFTLRGGTAPGTANPTSYGGGVYGGTVIGCVITNNSARFGGGVAYSVVDECVIAHNTASYAGGGAYANSAANPVVVTRSEIHNNRATGNRGGGVNFGKVSHSKIYANTSLNAGGGANYSTLEHCRVYANTVSGNYNGGGAHYGTLAHCLVYSNTTPRYGGGAYYAAMEQCLVHGNKADRGAGLYTSAGRITRNCTFTLNHSTASGTAGAAVRSGTHYNTIMWGNTRAVVNANNPDWIDITLSRMFYCSTPTPRLGNGNRSADPLFVDAANGNFKLGALSHCINAGNNAYVPASWNGADLAGHPRIYDLTVDIGAYEFFDGVTFHWNDGTSEHRLVTPEDWFYVLPEDDMERLGYAFAGWNTSPNGKGEWVTGKTPFIPATSTLNVYAVWVSTHNVIYNGNGGTPTMQETVSTGYYVLPEVTPARPGYWFDGWADAEGNAIDENTEFIEAESAHVVYAQWVAADRFTVILEPNTLTMNTPAPTLIVEALYGFTMPTIVPPVAMDPLLVFAGYTNALGKLYYHADGTGANVWDQPNGGTLYALWLDKEGDDVIYLYHADDTLVAWEIIPAADGCYVLPATNPDRGPGWTFTGWNTAMDGSGIPVTGDTPFDGSARRVYAQWEEEEEEEEDGWHWVYVDAIAVEPGGDVLLSWLPERVRYARAKYTVYVRGDLVLGDWEECPEGEHPGVSREADYAMRVLTAKFPATGKAFFKVKAIAD